MTKKDPQGPAAKPLSAWERRKLYSKQIHVNAQQRKQNTTAQAVCQSERGGKENVSPKKRRLTTAFCRKDDEGSVMQPCGPTKKCRLSITAASRPSASKTTMPPHKPGPSKLYSGASKPSGRPTSSTTPGPSKLHSGASKPSGRATTSTKSQKTALTVNNTKPAPSTSKAVTQTKKVADKRPLSEVAKQKNSTKPTTKSNNTKVPEKRAVPISSSAKIPLNVSKGLPGKNRRLSNPAVRRKSFNSIASKLANNSRHLSKPQKVSRKPEKNLSTNTGKNSTSKSLRPRKSILASGRREANKAKRVSMKMTPEAVPPISISDNLTPKMVPSPNLDSAEENLNTKLSRCAGSTPYRQSIMKKKSTPANNACSTRKLRSRVSFRSPAEIEAAESSITSVPTAELTPAKESSFESSSPIPTPYRSAEESIATTNSSTDDVYQTPYVEHIVTKSAGETPSRLSDVKTDLTKSAGSTPFRVASAKSVEAFDETVEDELNHTFTMESDMNEEAGLVADVRTDTSVRQPLSCLKSNKNVTQTRKSVSFVASQKERTVTPLRKTPRKSVASRSHLVLWLEQHGHSISSYRHLHCIGAELNNSHHKLPSTKMMRKSTPKACSSAKKSLCKDLGASPSLQPQASKEDKEAEGTTDIASVLKELYSLLKNGYPSDRANVWLDGLEKEVVQSYPGYWMCRSLACENVQDFTAALNWLVEGLEHLKAADKELLQELELLVNRVSVKENVSPSKKPASRKLRAKDISPANIFESTHIDYAVFEDNNISRISAAATGKKSRSQAVMTPVRRSTRRCNNVSKVETPSTNLVFKMNLALDC